MKHRVGKVLLSRLEEISQQSGGQLNIQDIDAIIESVEVAIKEGGGQDSSLLSGVKDIANEIRLLKQNLSTDNKNGNNASLGAAGLELDAIAQSTETAANTIMDACEQIQSQLGQLPHSDAKDAIQQQVTQIFEACNFQDLTGQRITKVIRTFDTVDKHISRLLKSFGIDISSTSPEAHKPLDQWTNEDFKNGPQLSKDAPSQDDIDKLFNG